MAQALGGWRLLVHVFLPIPLVLTALLVIPFPRNVRKGILLFTHKVLSFTMVGGMQLVHFALCASGIPLVDCIFRTMRASDAAQHADVRPETKISLLAKKWREERNLWISAMGFLLWCLLAVLFQQVTYLIKLEERCDELEDETCDLKGVPRPLRSSGYDRLANQVMEGVHTAGRRARAARAQAQEQLTGAMNTAAQRMRDTRDQAAVAVKDLAAQVKDKLPTGRGRRSGSEPVSPSASPLRRSARAAPKSD